MNIYHHLAFAALAVWSASALAQTNLGTAFTYQGLLEYPPGTPVTNTCEFQFGLWDAETGGSLIPGTSLQTVTGVVVTDGVFTATVNFGDDAITGDDRWLEISVDCGNPGDPFTLPPRAKLSPAPHALALPGLYTRQDIISPNIIGGFRDNIVTAGVSGATISGGGATTEINQATANFATIGGGKLNTASGTHSAITGGANNMASGANSIVAGGGGGFPTDGNTAGGGNSTVGGGKRNTASGDNSVVAGGDSNRANAFNATVGGGTGNTATGTASTVAGGGGDFPSDGNTAGGRSSTVGGGFRNTAGGASSTVPGGELNQASGNYSFAAGRQAKANHVGSFVWADATGFDFASTQANQFLIRAGGNVGIGTNTPIWNLDVQGNAINYRSSTSAPVGADRVLISESGNAGYLDAKGSGATRIVMLGTDAGSGGASGMVTVLGPGVPAGIARMASADGDNSQGTVSTFGPNGQLNALMSALTTNHNHGAVEVYDAAGDVLRPSARMYVDTSGRGVVSVHDTAGVSQASMSVNASSEGVVVGDVVNASTINATVKNFKIDHPLDPANKYLYHSSVESPDMMTVYNGNVATDTNGQAWVNLPSYFEALNRDFRYQLTVIGQFAQAIVAEEIENGRFLIRTDKPKVKVSWQVTGIRHDPAAEAFRVVPEVDKVGDERGRFLHPELFGAGPNQHVRAGQAASIAAPAAPAVPPQPQVGGQ